jgi:hypothetical protein
LGVRTQDLGFKGSGFELESYEGVLRWAQELLWVRGLGLGFWASGLGFGGWGSGFGVRSSGFGVLGLGFGFWSLGVRVSGV